MSQTQYFIKNLTEATANTAFPWTFPVGEAFPTFQAVLEHYANFYNSQLSVEDKKALSEIFWAQIKAIGTPIKDIVPLAAILKNFQKYLTVRMEMNLALISVPMVSLV